MFHVFENLEEKVNLPRQFTFPFFYTPHPLSVKATEILQAYIRQQTQWQNELSEGKMFGVLVVQTKDSQLGFLAAFSGQLAGSYLHDYFVPPIYDLNDTSSFFREEEKKIVAINELLADETMIHDHRFLKDRYEEMLKYYQSEKDSWKNKLSVAKQIRDQKREQGLTTEESDALIKESQFLKAEMKRSLAKVEEDLAILKYELEGKQNYIDSLRKERKERSLKLQDRLFEQFIICNAKGETKTLLDIFSPVKPPSGAGECCAPKLLQYAYTHQYKPVCMAEFWWGNSPKTLIRRPGKFYPSCSSKCKPILSFMLQGLNVERNPLDYRFYSIDDLPIVYEDEDIWVVNKPSGMLSVPGNVSSTSVQSILQNEYPELDVKVAHRLDMSTSGLLLVAKRETIFTALQDMFSNREIKKRYLAILEGTVLNKKGRIALPLCPNIENRPYQMVSYENGKEAVTDYEVIKEENNQTWIWFYPQTGRTHQLRVHAAHPDGLNCSIKGDLLYGTASERLYLQAQKIEFRHPKTHQLMVFELPIEF